MKKAILMLVVALTTFSFTLKETNKVGVRKTTYYPTLPSNIYCACNTTNVYWSDGSACCNVCCTIYGTTPNGQSNGQIICQFHMTTCCPSRPDLFVSNPPHEVATLYSIPLSISLLNQQTYTSDQLNYYYNFKANGQYTIENDITTTDTQGNITIYKAGNYSIHNSELQALVSEITL